MPTFTPAALNTPSDVIDYTATSKVILQISVDSTNLAGSDILNVKLSDNTTGSLVNMVNEDLTVNSVDPLMKSWAIILQSGDNFTMTLEQTAGTLRTFNYAIRSAAL